MPGSDTIAEYRAAGWWRDSTFLDDVARHARQRPDRPAIVSYRDGALDRTVTFGELPALVERFACALRELGVRRGDVVVLYLPNLWVLTPLYLACARIGAVGSPVIPLLAGRELGEILTASGATVCITIDSFDGADFAARLAESAPDTLAHRVVIGDAGATGAIDFQAFFVDTPWERREPLDPALAVGPDDPAIMIYTSGTSGRRKAVVHSHNTVYAAVRSVSVPYGLGDDDVLCLPSYLTHMAGMTYAGYQPLLLGVPTITQDHNTDMGVLLDLIERHRITWIYSAPGYLLDLVAAQRERPRDTASLRLIVSGSAPVPPQLIASVRETFGVPLHALWGMTENGGVTVTRPQDPEGWAANSDGSAGPSTPVRIVAEPDTDAGRLLVRGASQCLGYFGQRAEYEACLDAEGWFDTGDLARDDGRGGIRIVGRRSDLITRSNGMKVSVLEVEALLQRHPSVAELALVGYPDPAMPDADLVCAVVAPDGPPPTLGELREHLATERVAAALWPDRLQFVWQLPKNSLGKVLRKPLRDRLEIAASRP